MSAALGNADVDARHNYEIADLRLASVTAAGKILRWHVVTRNDITVGELLNVIVTRSQATHSPLRFKQVVLVELVNSRLHRTFDNNCKLGKMRRDDYLVVYEVPTLDGQANSGKAEFQMVACHARLLHDPAVSFFSEAGEMHRDLIGLPLMFKVPVDVTERHLYELVAVGMYGASYEHERATSEGEPLFSLYSCEHARALTTGGSRIDPVSDDQARLSVHFADRAAALLVAEWSAAVPLAPWVLHQVSGPHTDIPESLVEVYIGIDVLGLLQQVRLLQESRLELQDEIIDLRRVIGRKSAAAMTAHDRSVESNNERLIRPEAASSPISYLGIQTCAALKGKLAASRAADFSAEHSGTTTGMSRAATRQEILSGLPSPLKLPPAAARPASTPGSSRRRNSALSATSLDSPPLSAASRDFTRGILENLQVG